METFIEDWCEISKIILFDRPKARDQVSDAFVFTLKEQFEKIPHKLKTKLLDAINIVNIFMKHFDISNFLSQAIEYSSTITENDYSNYKGGYLKGEDSNKWIKLQAKGILKHFSNFHDIITLLLDILDPLWTSFEYLSYLIWSNQKDKIKYIATEISNYLKRNDDIPDF